ncbi:MAG: hypothetical protein NTU84_05955, partial [Verrucomicrobia bacterium]|nr:hypothetical protein [Verrucomicrobiota bacterium]
RISRNRDVQPWRLVVFFLQIEPEPQGDSGKVDQALESGVGIGGKIWLMIIRVSRRFRQKFPEQFNLPRESSERYIT